MSVFAIGDTHLSFSVEKPMDIFGGWSDYVYRLKRNWERVIDEDDTVVIPGDISWGMSLEESKEDFRFLSELPGEKIILKGNHDYWWTTKNKMDKFLLENGFSDIKILHNNAFSAGRFAICGTRGWFYDAQTGQDQKVIAREAARLERSIIAARELGGSPLVFLHYPPVMADKKCEEIFDVLKRNEIDRCFFGHLHGEVAKNFVSQTVEGIKLTLVSADFLEFSPKIIEKF